ncbi:MAG: hypothetical protein KAJ37_01505, partial [Candidatus Krumholzibacteria bacterium]|nr:hypothetical protein [Candidatus Krumholzibacteria bacterium]
YHLGPCVHYQALESSEGFHLQMLAGSTSVDTYRTFVDPSILPAFRAQALAGETELRLTHDRTHPFPIGTSTKTIPADDWALYDWQTINSHVQAKAPSDVLVYDFLLDVRHPFHDMLIEDAQAGKPLAASLGMQGVFRRKVSVDQSRIVSALVGSDPRCDHVALIAPGKGANPDANHGILGVGTALQSLFANALEVGAVVQGATFHVAHLEDPDQFEAFEAAEKTESGRKVTHYTGRKKGTTDRALVSVRYPSRNWTIAQAKTAAPKGATMETATGKPKRAPNAHGPRGETTGDGTAAQAVLIQPSDPEYSPAVYTPPKVGRDLFEQRLAADAGTNLFETATSALSSSLRSTLWRHTESGEAGLEDNVLGILAGYHEFVTRELLEGSVLQSAETLQEAVGDKPNAEGDSTVTTEELMALIKGLGDEDRAKVREVLGVHEQGGTGTPEGEATPEGEDGDAPAAPAATGAPA